MSSLPDAKPYIMVDGEPVVVDEKYTESRFLSRFSSYNGKIPIKIKPRSLKMALNYCVGHANKNDNSIWDMGLGYGIQDAFNLIHAASWLDIKSLFDQLFDSVVYMIDDATPEEIGKIFKVRYNNTDRRLKWMNYVLDCAPKKEEMEFDRGEILIVPPDKFKNLTYPQKRYWVYAHLVIKRNPDVFIATKQLSKEEEDSDEEEESKNDDVGGSGPSGVAWKSKWQFDD